MKALDVPLIVNFDLERRDQPTSGCESMTLEAMQRLRFAGGDICNPCQNYGGRATLCPRQFGISSSAVAAQLQRRTGADTPFADTSGLIGKV
jgi:hypothetical protein